MDTLPLKLSVIALISHPNFSGGYSRTFRGVGLFINKKRPWMIDILFYIVIHDPQNWVKVDVLKKLGTDHSFCFGFVL